VCTIEFTKKFARTTRDPILSRSGREGVKRGRRSWMKVCKKAGREASFIFQRSRTELVTIGEEQLGLTVLDAEKYITRGRGGSGRKGKRRIKLLK